MKEFKYLIERADWKKIYKLMPLEMQGELLDDLGSRTKHSHFLPRYPKTQQLVSVSDEGWKWINKMGGDNPNIYLPVEGVDPVEVKKAFFAACEEFAAKQKALPSDYVWQFGEQKGQPLNSPKSVEVEEDYEEKGFVYFIRNGEMYKIGETQNLLRRLKELEPNEVLNVVRCSNRHELEKELHDTFKEVRLPQSEYFRLDKSQIEGVHQIMRSKSQY